MFLGIEIGGSKLQIALSDGRTLQTRWRGNVNRELGGPGIRKQIPEGIAELRRQSPTFELQAIGVGFGGPIDARTGRICTSHQIGGWDEFPLRDWLSDLYHVPVAVDNDSNTAALGEALQGAGRGFDPVFYFNMGSGVGGGLVVGGSIYHGRPPGEAEFGHVRLDREGTIVESRCSGWAIDARLRAAADAEPDSPLGRLIHGQPHGGEGRYLSAALAQNDAAASRILQELSTDLAFALSHMVHLVHPSVIVMGGGLSLVGEPLRSAVAQALPTFVMHAFHPTPEIRLAGLGEDAVPCGAIELAAAALELHRTGGSDPIPSPPYPGERAG